MRDALQEHLNKANAAEAERMMDMMETEEMLDPRIRSRIADKLDERLKAEKGTARTRVSGKGYARFPLRRGLFLAAAACLVAFLVLGMTVPGVSKALYALAHPLHDTESYLLTPPEERTPIPEIEEEIGSSRPMDVSSSVEMLGEYSMITGYDKEYNEMATNTPTQRESYGFSPYRAEEYDYLKSLVPEVREVFYDGSRLTVNTYFECDYAADFMIGWGFDLPHRHNLDMTAFEIFADVDGRDVSGLLGGYGTGTMMSVWNHTSEDDLSGLEGFWCSTDFDDLASPLPDGICTVTILYYIYDGDVDDMGAIGNVARVIHTFSFDTTPGNRYKAASVTTPLSGDAVITIASWDTKQFRSRTVSLEGVILHTDFRYLPTGMLVTVEPAKVPADWTKPMVDALFGRISGLEFDLVVDGDRVEMPARRLDSGSQQIRYELPILPSDYENVREIALAPKVRALTSVRSAGNGAQGESSAEQRIAWAPDGEAATIPSGWDGEAYAETPLPGCEIHIPMPDSLAEQTTADAVDPESEAATGIVLGHIPTPEEEQKAAGVDPEIGSIVRDPLRLAEYYPPEMTPYTITRIDGDTIRNVAFPMNFAMETYVEFGEKAIRVTLTFSRFAEGIPQADIDAFLQINDGTMASPGKKPGLQISYNLGTKNEPQTYPEVERRGDSLRFLIPVTPDRYSMIDPGISVSIVRADTYDRQFVDAGWNLKGFDEEKVGYGWHGWIGYVLGMHTQEEIDGMLAGGVLE